MLQNMLGVNTKIDIGDYVFVYKYSDRKNIDGLDDLYKIKVEEISPPGAHDKNIIVSGVFETVNDDDQIIYERITGVVAYKGVGRLIETSAGIMYGNYYLEKKRPVQCLRRLKNEYEFFDLVADFAVTEKINIRVILNEDIIFPSIENAEQYIENIKITHAELHSGYLKFEVNGIINVFSNFEIVFNNKIYTSNEKLRELFEHCCSVRNSKNETRYNFNKVFSLKHTGYELDQIQML